MSTSKVEWATYQFNFEFGCIHNCQYPYPCWAKDLNDRFKWTPIWAKPVLRKEKYIWKWIDTLRYKPRGNIFFQELGDAYQRIPIIQKMARRWLKVLLPMHHIVLILTKSPDVRKDFDLITQYENVKVGFTITSLEKNPYEPFAPPNPERIKCMREAHDLGIETFASIEPWIPKVTDPIQIVEKTSEFCDYYIIGSLNYRLKPVYPSFYRKELPKLIQFLKDSGVRYRIKKELLRLL